MQIAFVIQHYPPYLGGAERQASILAQALAQRGYHVQVITTRFRKDLLPVSSQGLLRVSRWPTAGVRVLKLPINLLTGFMAGLSIAKRVDLFHAHCLSPFVLGALLAARLRRRPILVKVCSMGSDGDVVKVKGHALGRWLWPLFRQANLLIAQTRSVADELIAEGAAPKQVDVVSNLLSANLVDGTSERRQQVRRELGLAERLTLLFVGRLSPEKGLDRLMRIWPAIASLFDVQWVIVGDGPQRIEIERWRSRYDLMGSVILVGYQADPDLYYRAADIFVFPSQSEAFGNAIVEAMAHGLAVVTTRVGVVNEWPEDAPVQRFDVECDALVSALTDLISDGQRRAGMGAQARAFIAGRYGIDAICEQYMELYARLTSQRAATADFPACTRNPPN